jgi:hypothetical protein
MNKDKFDLIVSNQEIITGDIIKAYANIVSVCGFENTRGYRSDEYSVKPIREYGEIRLIEDNDTYSNYIKVNDRNDKNVTYGIYRNYLVKNIYNDTHIVYKLK